MDEQQRVIDTLRGSWLGGGILVRRAFLMICEGDFELAALLSQIYWWHIPDDEGVMRLKLKLNGHYWLVKQYADWKKEIGMGERQARHNLAKLKERGFVVVETHLSPFHLSETGNRQTACFIRIGWPALLAALDALPFGQPSPDDTPRVPPDGDPYYIDLEHRSTTTQNPVDSASGAGKLPVYGYRNRVPKVRMGGRVEDEVRKHVAASDADWPQTGNVIMSLLKKYVRNPALRLTKSQAEDLRKPVVTRTGETYPSPEDEARDYPDLWKAYTDQIENTAAWRKRFLENKEPVTAGKIVQLFRGYDHYEGWLSFKQSQARPAAKSSMGVNDLIGDLYGDEE